MKFNLRYLLILLSTSTLLRCMDLPEGVACVNPPETRGFHFTIVNPRICSRCIDRNALQYALLMSFIALSGITLLDLSFYFTRISNIKITTDQIKLKRLRNFCRNLGLDIYFDFEKMYEFAKGYKTILNILLLTSVLLIGVVSCIVYLIYVNYGCRKESQRKGEDRARKHANKFVKLLCSTCKTHLDKQMADKVAKVQGQDASESSVADYAAYTVSEDQDDEHKAHFDGIRALADAHPSGLASSSGLNGGLSTSLGGVELNGCEGGVNRPERAERVNEGAERFNKAVTSAAKGTLSKGFDAFKSMIIGKGVVAAAASDEGVAAAAASDEDLGKGVAAAAASNEDLTEDLKGSHTGEPVPTAELARPREELHVCGARGVDPKGIAAGGAIGVDPKGIAAGEDESVDAKGSRAGEDASAYAKGSRAGEDESVDAKGSRAGKPVTAAARARST